MMGITPDMSPPHSNKALATVLSLSVASGLAWAGPPMQLGPYQAEAYGSVEFSAPLNPDGTQGERVTATASGGPCDFPTGTEVLSGELQGETVLVGSLLLCQEGDGCPAQVSVPVLATYNATDRVLSALVKLREGCRSKALPGGSSLVVLKSTTQEPEGEGENAEQPGANSPLPARVKQEGGGSATAVAEAQGASADLDALMKEGQRALSAGNFSNANGRFGLVYFKEKEKETKEKENVEVLVGLGASHIGLKEFPQGFKYLEDARKLKPGRADIHLWMAYGWFLKGDQPKFRSALDLAMAKGWKPGNPMDNVPSKALEGELGAARERQVRKQQGQAGAGSPRP